jgi:cysteine-S-conjugate beta-lyase
VSNPFDDLSLGDLQTRRSEKWRIHAADVLPVCVAEMDFPLAGPIVSTVHDMMERGDSGYTMPMGLPEAYAQFAFDRYGIGIQPSRISPVLDVMRGIFLALQMFTVTGDGVVVNPPVYPPFYTTIRFAGRQVLEAPLARESDRGVYELDLDALERAFRDGARAYLLCNPHNPTGRVLTRRELEEAATLAERYDVMVLSDEVYAPLTYPRVRHVPFASLDSSATQGSVSFVSASKAWNLPGLKCALAIAGSEATHRALQRLPNEVHIEPSILGVAANEAAFLHGVPWLEATLAYLDSNRDAPLGRPSHAAGWGPPRPTRGHLHGVDRLHGPWIG